MNHSKVYYFTVSIYIDRKNAIQFLTQFFYPKLKELREIDDTYWLDFHFSKYKGDNLSLVFYSQKRSILKEIKPFILLHIEEFIKSNQFFYVSKPAKVDKLFIDFPCNSIVDSEIYKQVRDSIFNHCKSNCLVDLVIILLQNDDSNKDGFIEYWIIQLFILSLDIGFNEHHSCSNYLNLLYTELSTNNFFNEESLKKFEKESEEILCGIQNELTELVKSFKDKNENLLEGNFNCWAELFKKYYKNNRQDKSTEQITTTIMEELLVKLGGERTTYIHIVYLLKSFYERQNK